MGWQVQLNTAKQNEWAELMEQKLTHIRDLLDIAKVQEEELGHVWKSSAMKQWDKGFLEMEMQTRELLDEMKQLLLAADEAAYTLAAQEKSMIAAAEKL